MISEPPVRYPISELLTRTASNLTNPWIQWFSRLWNWVTWADGELNSTHSYGAFHDTTTQTAAATTPTAITFNSTDYSSGVSVGTPTSRIVFSAAGIYNIQFSIQFTNSSATLDTASVWLRVNGTDVANTNSWVDVTGKHGARDGDMLMALNVFYTAAAGDYFELIWMSLNGTASVSTLPASAGPPTYPASPSIILTVSDNIA